MVCDEAHGERWWVMHLCPFERYKIWGWEKNPQPTHIYLDLNPKDFSLFPKSIQPPNLLFSSMPIFFSFWLESSLERGKGWPSESCLFKGRGLAHSSDLKMELHLYRKLYLLIWPRLCVSSGGPRRKWLTASIFPWHFPPAVPSNLSSMWPWDLCSLLNSNWVFFLPKIV